MTYYATKYGYDAAAFQAAAEISDSSFALPVGPHVNEEDITHIATQVANILVEARI